MIDTHAHIDTSAFDNDRDEMIQRAFDSGITQIIIPAIEPDGFENIVNLSSKYDEIFFAMGIHPHNSKEFNMDTEKIIERNLNHDKAVAVGEIGLDYYYDFAPKDLQRDVFRKQLKLAKKYNLPAIIHNRDADGDIIKILTEEQNGDLNGVLHCFSSPVKFLEQAIELGFYVSFTGNITFKNSNLNEVVSSAPLDRILTETDSPYMTPVPLRGKRNEPANLNFIVSKISEIKSTKIDEVITMTINNAKRLFGIASFLFILTSSFLLAQQSEPPKFKNDIFEEQIEYYPYEKLIGIGGFVGTNTVVQTFYEERGNRDVSYEGIVFYGGNLTYAPIDFLLIQFSYLYSKNKKIVESSKGLLGPNINHVLELSTIWVVNPHSRVNFFGTIGPSLMFNTFDQGGKNEKESNTFGINTGVGFFVNIPIKGAGLFNISAEWRLNFDLTVSQATVIKQYDPDPNKIIYADYELTSFFSMPRLGLYWYPFNGE